VTSGRIGKHRWCRLHDPIYGYEHFAFVGPHANLESVFKRVLPASYMKAIGDGFKDDSDGRCVRRQVSTATSPNITFNVLWVNTDKSDDVLACLVHEMVHAATFTLDYVGVKADWVNDEPLTYYVMWLFKHMKRGLKL
jgi:hypothetical protein